jgi:hypothetical protein
MPSDTHDSKSLCSRDPGACRGRSLLFGAQAALAIAARTFECGDMLRLTLRPVRVRILRSMLTRMIGMANAMTARAVPFVGNCP